MRILMLGWELPPMITGGLGVACDGLLSTLPIHGRCHITFVLPTSAGCRNYPGVTIVGVDEYFRKSDECSHPELIADSEKIGSYSGAGQRIESQIEKYHEVVLDLIQKETFDLIHAHDWLTIRAGMLAKRIIGSPLIFHVHSLEQDRSPLRHNLIVRNIEEAGLNTADKIIAVSAWTRSRISALYDIDDRRIEVVHNGIAPQKTPERPEERNTIVIGFLGRITAQKGPKTFVNLARELLQRGLKASFRMAGTGDLLIPMQSLVKAYKINKQFSFDGFLLQDEILSWLSGIDILVIPSIYEPFGLVALEAAQANTVVVINREAGVCEIFKNFIKVSNDIEEYVNAVGRLEDRVSRRHAACEASLEVSKFTWANTANQLFEVYLGQSLIQAKSLPNKNSHSNKELCTDKEILTG